MSDASWTPIGSDGTWVYSLTTLSVFWPEAEHQKVIAQWPHLSDDLGSTWDEHRQRTERHRALVDRMGHKVSQLPESFSDLQVFLAGKGVTMPSVEDLLAYPDLRTVTAAMVPWPPARTDPCWCGSGRRYKRCCRPHGLGTLDDDWPVVRSLR
jgi:hypothetical protein